MPNTALHTGCLILAAPLLLTAAAQAGGIRYVDDDAPAGGDGLGWESAWTSLQDGLAAARADSAITELRLAGGTYVPAIDEGEGADRHASFDLVSGLSVRGGYAGAGAADPDERDLVAYETRLSGDLAGNDGPDFKNDDENSYQVVTAYDLSESTLLDGVTVSGGRANGADHGDVPESRDRGAAINIWGGNPTFRQVRFVGHFAVNHGPINDRGLGTTFDACLVRGTFANSHAAGIYCGPESATTITGCRFEQIRTLGNGGGVYNDGSLLVHCSDCQFEDNLAVRGSGIFTAENGRTAIEDCTFTGNDATRAGAGIFNQHNDSVVSGCTFIGNTAVDAEGGGGIWNEGGSPHIENCSFVANHAFRGAGVYSLDSDATIIGCTFTGNTAQVGAGAWNDGGAPYLADCSFVDNVALTGGGAYNENGTALFVDCFFMHNEANIGDGGGGIVNSFDSAPTIIGCTFTENTATNDLFGGGGGVAIYVSSANLFDCVFTRNVAFMGGGAIYIEAHADPGPVYISHCRFEGNVAGDGGAIHNFRSPADFTNCVFVGNRTAKTGLQRGGALYNHFISYPRVANCTFASNEATYGRSIANADMSHPIVVNTIVWDEGPGGIIEGDETDARYSLVRGGYEGPANLDADPRFERNPDPGPDGVWGTADDDYGDVRLGPDSPAIDAGHNWHAGLDPRDRDGNGDSVELMPIDVDGQPRFSGAEGSGCGLAAIVDIGACERPGGAASVRFGDLDGDAIITVDDLLEILGSWGPCGDPCCLADLDLDGEVSFLDLLEVLGRWG